MSTNQSSVIEGNVAEIVSKTQLIITPGQDAGIKAGDKFQIVAEEKEQVRDPHADRVLEEIPVIKATVVVKTVHEKCCLVENAATRDEERPIGSRYDILLGRANIPTQTVTLIEDLRVDDRTIRQVDRTIKVGDRCVKI